MSWILEKSSRLVRVWCTSCMARILRLLEWEMMWSHQGMLVWARKEKMDPGWVTEHSDVREHGQTMWEVWIMYKWFSAWLYTMFKLTWKIEFDWREIWFLYTFGIVWRFNEPHIRRKSELAELKNKTIFLSLLLEAIFNHRGMNPMTNFRTGRMSLKVEIDLLPSG